ncbi:MAG: hypothetical protein PHY28_01680, partial [Dehalococcoidales bacterium]|nr:hypothetical protein [Dehalococcoidales bacterium]
ATHTTTSSLSSSDTINTSALSNGSHTVKLYLKSSNKNTAAQNSVFEVYRTYTYAASGTIVSAVWDTQVAGSRWDALFWYESLPSGTDITFEVRAAEDTSTLQGKSWTAIGGTSPVLSIPDSGRYQQWRATLAADSARANTPVLQEVSTYYYGG